jgi:nucleoid-associated protein YgaU
MLKALKERLNSADSFVSMALGLAVVLLLGMLVYNYVTSKQATTAQKAQEEAEAQKMALPASYTVAQGDTLWTIAEKYYQSGYNWVDIAKANNLANADLVEAGQTLTIPEATPIMPQGQIAAATTSLGNKEYTVAHGDSLWSIAMAQYGDAYQWSAIAQANNLTNPDLIHAGNVLVLP